MEKLPNNKEIKNRLKTSVSRPRKREQGEKVFGVEEFNNNPSTGDWASGGKLFGKSDVIGNPEKRAKDYFYNEQTLRKPDMHDTVLYSATVAIADSERGRDTYVVAPNEEVEIILTDIEILDRRPPGESV